MLFHNNCNRRPECRVCSLKNIESVMKFDLYSMFFFCFAYNENADSLFPYCHLLFHLPRKQLLKPFILEKSFEIDVSFHAVGIIKT